MHISDLFADFGRLFKLIRYSVKHPRSSLNVTHHFWLLRRPSGPIKLHLGCGRRRLEGFVNIDMNLSSATDYICDVARLPCPDNTVERIENYHVIEHIPLACVRPTLIEWLRVLKPGGTLVVECPDLAEATRQYLAGNQERMFSIYGRQRFPGDAHHWGYTNESLIEMLRQVGFCKAIALPPQDYHKVSEPCIRVESQKP